MDNLQGLKFLVVDDLRTMRNAIRFALGHMGCTQVSEAADGAIALEMLKAERFDFVVSDINMPNMDGLALLRRIRQDPDLWHLPVLIVTSADDMTMSRRALGYGAAGYARKSSPDAARLLQEEVRRIIAEQTSKASS